MLFIQCQSKVLAEWRLNASAYDVDMRPYRQDEYVRLASRLARSGPGGRSHHLGTLSHVRAAVEEERSRAPLFDTDLWVANLQRLLFIMWETAHATGTQTGSPEARHLVLSGHRGWGFS